MSFKTFKFALLGLALTASSAVAAPIVTFNQSVQNRSQTQGGGNYRVIDVFYSSSEGQEFLGYQLTATATTGSLFDPARGQDQRQSTPDNGENGETRGAVDLWVNTVASAAAGTDFGYLATITSNPAGYNMAGGSQTVPAAAFTMVDVAVNDTVVGDDNNMNDHPDGPFGPGANAPYHIARILASETGTGTIRFETSDTGAPDVASLFTFDYGQVVANTPPTIVSPAAQGGVSAGAVVVGDFNATDTETPGGPFTFSGLSLASFTPSHGGSNPPGLFGGAASIDPATGVVTWNTAGFARGLYDITANVADQGPGDPLSAGNNPGHWQVTISQVPEPSTLALLGLAMVGSFGLIRRRNG